MGEDRLKPKRQVANWDAAALLKLMWESWNDVFRKTLGPAERSLLSELRDQRNKWAHQQTFSSDDAYRALDSAGRLLTAVSNTRSFMRTPPMTPMHSPKSTCAWPGGWASGTKTSRDRLRAIRT